MCYLMVIIYLTVVVGGSVNFRVSLSLLEYSIYLFYALWLNYNPLMFVWEMSYAPQAPAYVPTYLGTVAKIHKDFRS
jgi:hypothetical protein